MKFRQQSCLKFNIDQKKMMSQNQLHKTYIQEKVDCAE